MRIVPVAFDSFSVRSMATFVVTGDASIFIDPGIAIGPRRYGLPPSEVELSLLHEQRREIISYLENTDIVTISHYHFDHHPHYDDSEFCIAAYKNKIIYAKSPEKINLSQKKRNYVFERIAKPLATELIYADGESYGILSFSEAVYHGGEKTRLGYVIMCCVEEKDKRFMHCSDIQGPVCEKTADIIIQKDPDIAIIGGPPTYFLGWRFSQKDLRRARGNILRIGECSRIKKLILDHHLLRDISYRENFYSELKSALSDIGVELMTAAEFAGKDITIPEARRKEIYMASEK